MTFFCALLRVLVRFRPLSQTERPELCIEQTSASSVQHTASDGTRLAFTFDGVHGEDASQQDMFEKVQDIVRGVLQGHNGSIIAYGQTGVCSLPEHCMLANITDEEIATMHACAQYLLALHAQPATHVPVSSCQLTGWQAAAALCMRMLQALAKRTPSLGTWTAPPARAWWPGL